MRAHRPVRQLESLSDLLVDHPGRGQHCDLALPGCEPSSWRSLGSDAGPAGGPQLAAGSCRPRERAEPLERLQRRRQMLAGFDPRPGPPETGAVGQLHSGQVERPAVNAGEGQRQVEQLTGLVVRCGDRGRCPGQRRQSRNRGDVSCAIPRYPFNARANSSRANGLRPPRPAGGYARRAQASGTAPATDRSPRRRPTAPTRGSGRPHRRRRSARPRGRRPGTRPELPERRRELALERSKSAPPGWSGRPGQPGRWPLPAMADVGQSYAQGEHSPTSRQTRVSSRNDTAQPVVRSPTRLS